MGCSSMSGCLGDHRYTVGVIQGITQPVQVRDMPRIAAGHYAHLEVKP